MDIRLKRAYLSAEEGDGVRVPVDRLWPRGVSKEKARLELRLREIAPSTELRTWFHHLVCGGGRRAVADAATGGSALVKCLLVLPAMA